MTETIRARTAADFLALLPHMAGYTPRDSLVLVPFRGTRTAGVMRFDLPVSEVEAFAATAIGTVCRLPDADGVAIVIYTSRPWRGEPRSELVAALRSRAHACGLRVGDALCVAANSWARYGDGSPGHPLSEIATALTQFADPVEESQHDGVSLVAASPAQRAEVASALEALDDAVATLCGPGIGARGDIAGIDPRSLALVSDLDDPTAVWEDVLTWSSPLAAHPERAALVLWTLARPGMRDAALAQWSHGLAAGKRALDDQLRWEHGDPYPVGPLFLAGEGARPDPTRLRRARDVSIELAALAPARHRVAALAVAAWLSWALGAGTHADAYAQAALEEDPTHGLADIVRALTSEGRLPDWAFAREDGTS